MMVDMKGKLRAVILGLGKLQSQEVILTIPKRRGSFGSETQDDHVGGFRLNVRMRHNELYVGKV